MDQPPCFVQEEPELRQDQWDEAGVMSVDLVVRGEKQTTQNGDSGPPNRNHEITHFWWVCPT